MSEYDTLRDRTCLARLSGPIKDFANRYKHAPGKIAFLFPGGLGSDLVRSLDTFHPPTVPTTFWKPWLGVGSAAEGPARLQVVARGADEYEDEDRRIVVPDGGVDFVGLHPYAGFVEWCQSNNIHAFVLGWDWRLGIRPAANFFLQHFMPALEARLKQVGVAELKDFTLIGHSAGGMVVKAIANQASDKWVQRMDKAITVATPFYGYGAQIHLFLKGHKWLNSLLGGHDNASRMARIISSMPGGYEFLYLDQEMYEKNATAFKCDSEKYKLCSYPSVDWDDGTEIADPYNPTDTAEALRYPNRYGFDKALLQKGNDAARLVSGALDAPIRDKFYCIRGIQRDENGVVARTVVGHRWRRVPISFDADRDRYDIEDQPGPGDGVQPAWTARLLGLGDGHIIDATGDVEHQTMMIARPVQEKLAPLLGLKPEDVKYCDTSPAQVPKKHEFNAFLESVRYLRELVAGKALDERFGLPAGLDKLGLFGDRWAKLFMTLHKTPGQL
jgi:Lecithin:cholesterol acyltransferase